MQGKSCFNFVSVDEPLFASLRLNGSPDVAALRAVAPFKKELESGMTCAEERRPRQPAAID